MQKIWNFAKRLLPWVLIGLLVAAAIYLLQLLFGARPPNEFTIATGREDGAYYAFAKQYQARFAEEGYRLNIRPTSGLYEIVDLLNSGEADAGFIQSTDLSLVDVSGLSALANLYYEPVWVLYRQDLPEQPTTMAELEGLRIGIGEERSGTNEASTFLLDLSGINGQNSTFITAPSSEAAEQLKRGELDVMILLAGTASPLVEELLLTPGIDILPITRSDAYTSRYKEIFSVVLDEGVIDLDQNIPSEDKQLLAAKATLVTSNELHPDLARLLLIIATEIHGRGGILEDAGEFPAPIIAGIAMNKDAVRFLENGPTGLEEILPLWMASRLERVVLLLLPIMLILYPVISGAPAGLRYINHRRIRRRYVYLRELDQGYKRFDRGELDEAIANLESFQNDISDWRSVPKSMLDEYYNLRLHTSLTLERLNDRRSQLEEENQMPTINA